MTIKAIIFDVGGVLVRTEDPRPRTLLADGLGLTAGQLEHSVFGGETGLAWQHGEISSARHWENVRQQFNLHLDEMPAFQDAFFGGDVLDHELVQTIRELRPRYITAILSNMGDSLRQLLEERWKIAPYFDHLIISAEVGLTKPDRRIYEIAIQRCGTAPHEAVFIDDFPHNIAAAQQFGMHGILFQSREQVTRQLESLLS